MLQIHSFGKEMGKFRFKEQVNVCVCPSPNFYVYTSRAFAERSAALVFLVLGCTPTKCQLCSLQSSECNVLLSETLSTAGFNLPSNRVLKWLFLFCKIHVSKCFMTFGNLVSIVLCTIWSTAYDDRWEQKLYELKYIESRVKLV